MAIIFTYEKSSLCDTHEVLAATTSLEPIMQEIKNAQSTAYTTPYAPLNLPFDTAMHCIVQKCAEQKLALHPHALLVIGIGGSNLGALAVHQALHGPLYNMANPSIACYWADTVAPDDTYALIQHMRQLLSAGKKIIITIISKSGSTLETSVNTAIFIQLLKEFHPHDYQQYIVVITDKESSLWQHAQQESYTTLEIPANVGGRYSIMSAAGLFPLAMLGINIHDLCAAAADVVTHTMDQGPTSMAATSAALLAVAYSHGIHIHDLFVFDPWLASLGSWYRQLLAESIGKISVRDSTSVAIGFTPTVSIGSTDLHAMAQRILAGPRNTITTFVSIKHHEHDITVTHNQSLTSVTHIMHALLVGAQRAYQQAACPFTHCIMERKDAYTVGQFMQWKMIETIYLGFLLGVNPFDQPQVELYKQETRKIVHDA